MLNVEIFEFKEAMVRILNEYLQSGGNYMEICLVLESISKEVESLLQTELTKERVQRTLEVEHQKVINEREAMTNEFNEQMGDSAEEESSLTEEEVK